MAKTKEKKPPPDADHILDTIKALQRDYDESESRWLAAKDEAASLKKIAEAKARRLYDYNRALSAPVPLFEVWRQEPLADLGLPEIVVSLLGEAGLTTIGQLADWTASGKKLTEIPHMGEAKAKAVEDALESYWRRKKEEGGDG